jgi:hypothetical protein
MARYQSKEKLSNNIQISAIQYKYRGRKIASTEDDQVKARYFNKLSDKSIYFLTLHNQYQELGSFVPQRVPQVESCPRFHTALVDTPPASFANKKINYEKVDIHSEALSHLALYPELALPVRDGAHYDSLKTLLTKETHKIKSFGPLLLSAVQLRLSDIHQELESLCQTGQSPNYYIYDNLISYHADQIATEKNTKTMKILLKTNLFVNTAIIKSMHNYSQKGGRSIASFGHSNVDSAGILKKEGMRRLGAEWTDDYFKTIYTKRRTLGDN